MCFFAVGVAAGAAAELEAAAGVAVSAAAASDFFECFLAGEAAAAGVGKYFGAYVGSAARTRVEVAHAAITIRVMRERMGGFHRIAGCILQG